MLMRILESHAGDLGNKLSSSSAIVRLGATNKSVAANDPITGYERILTDPDLTEFQVVFAVVLTLAKRHRWSG